MNFSLLEIILGTSLSCIGLFLGYRRFLLKSGISLRGNYTTCASVECEDVYVSELAIENLKDRAITIYAIYLRLGPSYYLLLEEFVDGPLILKGFETYHREYPPLELYSINMKQVEMNHLLKDNKLKKNLVLSTSLGRFIIRKPIKRWNPVNTFFKNHFTGLIRPSRSTFKGKSLGSNAIYLVEFKSKDSSEHSVPIYRSDHGIRKFRDFSLTKESLESKEALEKLLREKQEEGILLIDSFIVHDLEALREKDSDRHSQKVIKLQKMSVFRYHVAGRIITILSNARLRRKNKENSKKISDSRKAEADSTPEIEGPSPQ